MYRITISSADEKAVRQQEQAAPEGVQRSNQARFQRPGENLPKAPVVDPALIFKGGILLAALLVAALILWIVKSLMAPVPVPTHAHASTPSSGEISEAPAPAPAGTVTIVALEAVRIKVVRKSDGLELFQGALQAGDRRDYPNTPLYLTATELGSIEIEYKGHRYPTGHTGHDRIQFDFSSR